MSTVLRVRVAGPLEPHVPGYAAGLRGQRFAPLTVSFRVQLAAHLSRWMAAEDLGVGDLDADVVERFVAARRGAGYVRYVTPGALEPLVGYLADCGHAIHTPEAEPSALDRLLDRYRVYLEGERGLTEGVVAFWVRTARAFLDDKVVEEQLELDLVPCQISAFVVRECARYSRGQAKLVVTALRSLLRFLAVEGLASPSLLGAVPAVAGWRFSGVPKQLKPGEVQRLLDSCDRRTVVGRRDFAILTLLARLGLRRGEVARLRLEDLDWRAGEITVRGKGDRWQRLPLPAEVGETIACYLRDGRVCQAAERCVFVRVRAPHAALTSNGIGCVVAAAGAKAGVGRVGAHRLRHTLASELLRAGAPLTEVGQVLRHRSLDSTAIYAKVDRDALRGLARPWPGALS